ncbi:MAG TPA: hypothetical protein VNE83_07895 [Terriglobales bacterium]|nr:hypothetical protein [Terriglobales bacterium]
MASSLLRRVVLGLTAVLAAGALFMAAQTPPAAPASAPSTCYIGPFQNRSGEASLDWIGESFAIALRQDLRGSGVTVLTRDQREQALTLAGIPPQAPVSHAGLIRVAGRVDARWLVVGWYDYDGAQLTTGASLIDLKREHLVALAAQSGPLDELEAVQARLAWALRQQVDPGAAPAEAPAEPSAGSPAGSQAPPPLPLRAYESYVRAELAASNAARLNDLETAVHFAPNDARILLALGEAELGGQHEAQALKTMLQVPPAAPEYPEAQFHAGLAAFRMRRYQQAESIFSGLEAHWPLPSVVADLALAKAGLAATSSHAAPAALKTDFPLESFLQLQRTVASFNAARLQALAPGARVATELDQGQRLLGQKAWDAAAQNFQRVLNQGSVATAAETSAAHAGLAAVWMAQHNSAQAAAEAAAALKSDSNNAAAQALQAQLGSNHDASTH